MEKEIINNAFSMTVPEGFLRMSAGELAQLFRDNNPNRWGVWDHERHAVVTVQWQQYSSLLLHLADLKSIAKRNEQLIRKGYEGHSYRLAGFLSARAENAVLEGYRFFFRVEGAAQVTETWLLKQGKTVYSISCTGREENESADAELFAGIISGLRVL